MTGEELRELLRQHHWSISVGKTGNQSAFSAKRRIAGGTRSEFETKYIATEQKLKDMTESEVIAKLNRSRSRGTQQS